ncbi:MAG: OmpA family protein [Crocinitomicaceae bacterium]|nr:OmpA family protein [Crocinitomicaceae bacterium]
MNISKRILIILLLVISKFGLAQFEKVTVSDKISDCDGATVIKRTGSYSIQFPGDAGKLDDLIGFPNLKELYRERNSLWLSFRANFDGELSFEANANEEPVSFIIFKVSVTDGCTDIYNGNAQVLREFINPNIAVFGLDQNERNHFLPSIPIQEGEQIKIFFNNANRNRSTIQLNFKFDRNVDAKVNAKKFMVKDYRSNENTPFLAVQIRDADTKLPITGQIIVSGLRTVDALYYGTDFFFNVDSPKPFKIMSDAEGYFYNDQFIKLEKEKSDTIILYLEPLVVGKNLTIQGIDFRMGNVEYLPGVEERLKRFRDFLILYGGVEVVIEGHVYESGKPTKKGKKLSNKRAKKVYKYLVNSGVDKRRLSYVGYGSERMKYPAPKTAEEEQANRRVEIKVIGTATSKE